MTGTKYEPNERYKVGKVISKYGLQGFHAELPDRWLGESRKAQSLRDIADELNIRILREAMESAKLEPLDGEVENTYRLLTEEEVSSGMRTTKRNQLEREGVDISSIESDFVTHQAIYAYLKEVLDVSKQDEKNSDPIKKHSERINRLRSRTEAVTSDSIASLLSSNTIKVSDPEVSVNIQIFCHQCNRQYSLSSLLTQRDCDCEK